MGNETKLKQRKERKGRGWKSRQKVVLGYKMLDNMGDNRIVNIQHNATLSIM